jgi:hypothetical protein
LLNGSIPLGESPPLAERNFGEYEKKFEGEAKSIQFKEYYLYEEQK